VRGRSPAANLRKRGTGWRLCSIRSGGPLLQRAEAPPSHTDCKTASPLDSHYIRRTWKSQLNGLFVSLKVGLRPSASIVLKPEPRLKGNKTPSFSVLRLPVRFEPHLEIAHPDLVLYLGVLDADPSGCLAMLHVARPIGIPQGARPRATASHKLSALTSTVCSRPSMSRQVTPQVRSATRT
jgi:hypothetical protein